MKKGILLGLISALAFGVSAQNIRITDAEVEIRNQNYESAKQAIDEAAANPATSNSPRMWKVRGDVYYYIAVDTLYTHLDPDAAMKSVQSYINCLAADKLEKKQKYTEDAMHAMPEACVAAYLRAFHLFQAEDYKKSLEYWDVVLKGMTADTIGGSEKRLSVSKNDIAQNCVNTALKANDKEAAKKYLMMMINDPKYKGANAYLQMSTMLLEDTKDTTAALDIIARGRIKIPDNKDLFNQELAIFQQRGQTDVLRNKLSGMIENEPNNVFYLYFRGTIVSDIAKKTAEPGTDYTDSAVNVRKKLKTAKTPADKNKIQAEINRLLKTRDSLYEIATADYASAEKDFNEALLLDPNYFDALYNLGVLYFNSNKIINDRYNYLENTPEDIKKGKEYEDQSKVMYEKALQTLLKAYEINAEDKGLLSALQQAYSQLGDKYKSSYYRMLKDYGKMDCDVLDIKSPDDLISRCGEPANKKTDVKGNKSYTTYEYNDFSVTFLEGVPETVIGL